MPLCSKPVLSQQTRAVSPNKAKPLVPWILPLCNRACRAKSELMASDQHSSVSLCILILPAQPGKPFSHQSSPSKGPGWCFSYREGWELQLRQELLLHCSTANAATKGQRLPWSREGLQMLLASLNSLSPEPTPSSSGKAGDLLLLPNMPEESPQGSPSNKTSTTTLRAILVT